MLGVPDAEGKKQWREFDVQRSFSSAEEARAYARDHGVRVLDDD